MKNFITQTWLMLAAFMVGSTTELHADSTSLTLAPLPEFVSGGTTEERINQVTISLDPMSANLTGKPGDTVGWSFQIKWESNVGDAIVFNTSTLVAAPQNVSTTGYKDLMASKGGNDQGLVLDGTEWNSPEPFVADTDGVGYLVIDENAEPNTRFTGVLNVNFTVQDISGASRKRIGSFTVPLEVSVTVVADDLQDQTITLSDITGKSVTDAPFPVVATASSELPVNVMSLTPDVCTIENGVATIHKAGTCAIFATQDGNPSYHTAPPVYHSFHIVKNPATVTIQGDMAQDYDGFDKTFTAVTVPTGLDVTWLYNGAETPPREPGIYIINALIDDATYTATAQARLTITDNRPPQLTNYQSWLESNFTESEILAGVLTGHNQELAGDNLNNLMKYAMGIDAKIPATPDFYAALPQIANPAVGGSIIFELPVTSPSDLTLRVKASSNLTDWEEIARRDANNPWTGDADVFMGTTTPDGSRIPTLITEPEPVEGPRFYRLEFTPFP